jgi:uncharacterized protein (DUF305 family)
VDVLLCQLMIRHHQGGLMMARALVARADQAEIRRFAEGMIAAQEFDIQAMLHHLSQLGAKPL